MRYIGCRQAKAESKVTFEQPLTEESEGEFSDEETESGESEKSEAGWPPVSIRRYWLGFLRHSCSPMRVNCVMNDNF